MVSRKQIHQKHKKNQAFIDNIAAYINLAVLAFLVIVIFLVLPINYSKVHFEAGEAVGQVYQDQEWVYLDNQADESKIEVAQQQVDQLFSTYPSLKKVSYNRALDYAQQKLEINRQFKDIFTEAEADVSSNLILNADISEQDLSAIKNEVEGLPHDPMRLELEAALVEAEDLLARMHAAQAGIEYLSEEIKAIEEINRLADQVVVLEEELKGLEKQAETESLYAQLREKTAILSQNLQEIAQEDTIAKINIEKLFQSHFFSDQLEGTIVDTRKFIALTFDDGPNPEYTPQVLDVLDKYQVKGTFFLMGQHVEKHPELAQEIVERGHLIGNHSYDHPDYELLTDEEVLDDFGKTQDIIEQVTQIRPVIYRTPYGGGGARVVRLLDGVSSIIWNLDSEDWLSRNSQTIYEKVMDELQPKTLLLMHDSHDATVPALELIIPALKEEGYLFVEPLKINFDYLFFE